jgi:hypothetical protein
MQSMIVQKQLRVEFVGEVGTENVVLWLAVVEKA